jgi:hypothetical protein
MEDEKDDEKEDTIVFAFVCNDKLGLFILYLDDEIVCVFLGIL